MFEKLLQDTTSIDTVSYVLRNGGVQSVDSLSTDVSVGCFQPFEGIVSNSISHALVADSSQWMDGYQGVLFAFPPQLNSLFFLLFLVCFLLFVAVFHHGKVMLLENMRGIFSIIIPNQSVYNRQGVVVKTWNEVFLIAQTILVLSIAIFTFFRNVYFHSMTFYQGAILYGTIVLLMVMVFLFRYFIHRYGGVLIIRSGMKEWTVFYLRTVELLGIASFLPSLFLMYVSANAQLFYMLLLGLFLISRFIIFWNLLSIFVKNKMGILYFIVYLCGVEIVPYVFLYKGAVFFIKILANIGV